MEIHNPRITGSLFVTGGIFITGSDFVAASGSRYVGDGSGLTGVTSTPAPAGSTTEIQFNDGGVTSAESTLGLGRKTVGGTMPAMRAVAWNATFTLSAPYASVDGDAQKRSPTSFWTITNMRCTCGTKSRTSAIKGVATL